MADVPLKVCHEAAITELLSFNSIALEKCSYDNRYASGRSRAAGGTFALARDPTVGRASPASLEESPCYCEDLLRRRSKRTKGRIAPLSQSMDVAAERDRAGSF